MSHVGVPHTYESCGKLGGVAVKLPSAPTVVAGLSETGGSRS
jgi:hypothetical protein